MGEREMCGYFNLPLNDLLFSFGFLWGELVVVYWLALRVRLGLLFLQCECVRNLSTVCVRFHALWQCGQREIVST